MFCKYSFLQISLLYHLRPRLHAVQLQAKDIAIRYFMSTVSFANV